MSLVPVLPISLSPYFPIYLSLYLPISSSIFSIPPHSNGDIRANLSAKSAAGACLRCLPDDVKISLAINLVSNPDQTLGTGDRTESASLAPLLINFNLAHRSPIKGSNMESGRRSTFGA